MTGRFVPLDPPPDGLSSVLVEGRRRRRRRTAAMSTASVAALAGVLALTVVPSGGGTDSLRPMPAAPGVLPNPSPSVGVPQIAPSPLAGTPVATAGGPITGASQAAPSSTTPRPPLPGSPSPAPQPAGYRTPDLVRTYAGPPAQARICGAAYSNDSSTGQVGWCVVVATERTARGVDLLVEVCRDGTTSGRLTYGTDHEADLAVLEDGRTLWQWSVGRTPVEDSHELIAEPGGCWTWRAPWTGVDQNGESLAGGTYLLRARSLADQLTEVPPTDTEFIL